MHSACVIVVFAAARSWSVVIIGAALEVLFLAGTPVPRLLFVLHVLVFASFLPSLVVNQKLTFSAPSLPVHPGTFPLNSHSFPFSCSVCAFCLSPLPPSPSSWANQAPPPWQPSAECKTSTDGAE